VGTSLRRTRTKAAHGITIPRLRSCRSRHKLSVARVSRAAYAKEYRQCHPLTLAQARAARKRAKRSYRRNRKSILARARAWNLAHPDAKNRHGRAHALRSQYDLEPEDYERLLSMQHGLCAICGKGETCINPRTDKARRLAVDHVRGTKNVRGLLCFRCNSGIGSFGHEPSVLSKAIVYLGKPFFTKGKR
jgi:hypothetical protein